MSVPKPTSRRAGFALVLSLTIMSLLVLVILSLAGFLAIESRLADQSLRHALARHNAVMSLRLAVAQLQLLAGPDQRVTATADLIDPAAVGLAAPTNPNYARFTGVWHAGPKADSKARRLGPVQRSANGYLYDTRFTEDGAALPAAGVHADGTAYDWRRDRERTAPDSRLLGWLVSGNEGRPVSDAAYLGPRSAWTVPSPAGRVPLVGPGTLGAAARDEGTMAAPTGRVELPTVAFPGSQGFGVTGRYAWWVGDEGVKARVNLPDPHAAFQPSATNPEEGGYYRLMTSQRANFTLVKDPVGGTATPFSGWDAASAATLASATGFGDLSSALANPSYDYRVLFHDLTFHSLGLHTDTSRGGLKRDLTPYLQLPAASTGIPGVNWVGVAPAGARAQALPGIMDAEAILEGAQFAGTGSKHGLIRSWFRQARAFDSAAPVSLADARRSDPAAGTSNNQNYLVPRMNNQRTTPVHPLLAQASVYFRPAYDSVDSGAYFLVYPRIVLWNPWNVPISSASYVVDVGQRMNVRARVNWSGASGSGQDMVLRFGNNVVNVQASNDIGSNPGSNVGLTDLVFTVPSADFRPGEALVFTAPVQVPAATLSRSVSRPQAAGIHPLAPAPVSGAPYFKWRAGNLPEPFASEVRNATLASANVTYWGNGYDFGLQYAVSFAGASYAYTNAPGQAFLLDATGFNALQMVDTDAYQRGNLGRWVSLGGEADGSLPNLAGGTPDILPHRTSSLNWRLIWHDEPGVPGAISTGVGADGSSHNRQFNLFVQNNPRSGRFIRSPWDLCFERRVNHDRVFGIYTNSNANSTLAYADSQLAPVVSSGRSRAAPFFSSTQASPSHVYTLYDLPNPALGVLSLGQLQHAAFAHFPWHPSLALGSGFADPSSPDVASSQSLSEQVGYFSTNFPNLPGLAHQKDDAPTSSYYNYDLAYELNAAMWDAYMVSGIPADDNGWAGPDLPWSRAASWPSARIVPLGSKPLPSGIPTAYYAPASTGVAGAFNVNSTSVRAWVALLSSARNLRVPTALATPDAVGTPFPRNLRPQQGKVQGAVSNASFNRDVWGGYRSLTDAEIETLATQVVAEVRRRGPFLSLADFVSRRLEPVDPATAAYAHPGNLGTLQAAIENAGLNTAFGAPIASSSATYEGDFSRIQRSGVADYADSEDNLKLRPRAAARVAHRSAGAPGYLLQSDILQQLAPALTARSDTFTIRVYGQATDSSGTRSLAEVWGEAVVQRMPDPVIREDDSVAAGLNPEQPAPGVARKLDLGRRFRVVSFRWIGRNDI